MYMADETNNDLTPEQMATRIKELEGRLAKGGTLRFRVSEKGAVSVYGLGRFPVTLYYEQWIKLLDVGDGLRTFLEENKTRLKLKGRPPVGRSDALTELFDGGEGLLGRNAGPWADG